MADAHDSFRQKVETLFAELAGSQRSQQLSAAIPASQNIIASALCEDFDSRTAGEIAFHVTDWNYDAAFMVALHLFPERFTRKEIETGIRSLLIHVPAHLLAAARLADLPAEDIFLEGKSND